MSQNVMIATPTAQPILTFKRLWRVDAVFNLVLADVLFFATGHVVDALGMSGSAYMPLRALAVYLWVYGLWQLWSARAGHISRNNFRMAGVEMLLAGTGFMAAVLLGAQVNALGMGLMVVFMGFGSYLMAAIWFMAARDATEQE